MENNILDCVIIGSGPSGYTAAIYAAIQGISDPTSKNKVLEAFNAAYWSADWMKEQEGNKIKTDFEAIIKIVDDKTTQKSIEDVLNASENKKTVEDYFTANSWWYTKDVNKTRFTITKAPDNKGYIVKTETINTTPPKK